MWYIMQINLPLKGAGFEKHREKKIEMQRKYSNDEG